MRILLTVHQFLPKYTSGTEVLTYSVAKELISRGHDVRILTAWPSDADIEEHNRFDEYLYEGIHIHRFHHAYTPMAGQSSMVALSYDNILAANYFDRILKDYRPEVIHFFHLNRLGTRLIDLAARAGIPAFMTPTDFWIVCHTGQLVLRDGGMCCGPSPYGGNCIKHLAQIGRRGFTAAVIKRIPTPWFGMLARLTQKGMLPHYPYEEEVKATAVRLGQNIKRVNQLNGILSPNQFMSQILRQHGVLPHLIVESAYGVDVKPCGRPEHRSNSRLPIRVGFIGTLAPHKGCDVLIKAFRALPGERAVLKIYGSAEDFPEYSGLLKRLAENSDGIEFCGTFQNARIGEVLAGLDALVVPSLWYENTPLVVYSAQAARCPVIASDFPGLSGVVRDGVDGLLFEAGNAAALAKGLSRLIDEPDLLESLSVNSPMPKRMATYVDELLALWTAA